MSNIILCDCTHLQVVTIGAGPPHQPNLADKTHVGFSLSGLLTVLVKTAHTVLCCRGGRRRPLSCCQLQNICQCQTPFCPQPGKQCQLDAAAPEDGDNGMPMLPADIESNSNARPYRDVWWLFHTHAFAHMDVSVTDCGLSTTRNPLLVMSQACL